MCHGYTVHGYRMCEGMAKGLGRKTLTETLFVTVKIWKQSNTQN